MISGEALIVPPTAAMYLSTIGQLVMHGMDGGVWLHRMFQRCD